MPRHPNDMRPGLPEPIRTPLIDVFGNDVGRWEDYGSDRAPHEGDLLAICDDDRSSNPPKYYKVLHVVWLLWPGYTPRLFEIKVVSHEL